MYPKIHAPHGAFFFQNKKDNDIVECKTTEEDGQKISYIIFSDGNQYTYKAENKSIYKNKIKMVLNYINSNKNEFFDNAKVTFDTLSTNFKDTLAYLKTQKV